MAVVLVERVCGRHRGPAGGFTFGKLGGDVTGGDVTGEAVGDDVTGEAVGSVVGVVLAVTSVVLDTASVAVGLAVGLAVGDSSVANVVGRDASGAIGEAVGLGSAGGLVAEDGAIGDATEERQRVRSSVAVDMHRTGTPAAVTSYAPSGEQKAPGTTLFAAFACISRLSFTLPGTRKSRPRDTTPIAPAVNPTLERRISHPRCMDHGELAVTGYQPMPKL